MMVWRTESLRMTVSDTTCLLFAFCFFEASVLSISESRTVVEKVKYERGKMVTKVATAGDGDGSTSFNKDKPFKLVLVQMLFRHGDRSPTHLYPSWNAHTYFWPQGAGQLTKIGVHQAYRYGQELRQRYVTTGTFLSYNYNQSEVEVRSTDMDRTLMTVQSILAGLFPTNMTDWVPGPWQPIPVHTQPEAADHLFGRADCQRLFQLRQQFQETSPLMLEIHSRYKPLRDQLSKFTKSVVNFTEADHIGDTMFCEAQHNLSRPSWMTDSIFEQLMTMHKENKYMCRLPGVIRLSGGPLLAEMITNMETRAANPLSPAKLKLFSAHDDTVGALGKALGIFNYLQPPYLTTITLELIEQEGNFFVKTLFDNHTVLTKGGPVPQNISGCTQECPLPLFHSLLKGNILAAEDRADACALNSISDSWKQNFLPIVVGVLMVLMVGVAVLLYKLKRARQRSQRGEDSVQYHTLLQSEEDNEEDDDNIDEL